MRAITTVAILFVVLTGLAFASYSYINASAHHLAGGLDQVEAAVSQGRWDVAQDQLGATQTEWERTRHWWTVLLNHREIDNIDLGFNRLEQYVASKGSVLSLGELAALRQMVTHIADTESPTLENIL